MTLDRLQDRDRRRRDAAAAVLLSRRWRTSPRCAAARDYPVFALNSIIISVSATLLSPSLLAMPAAYAMAFSPDEAHQGPPAVDAVDQDDAGGRRAGPDLPAFPRPPACSTRRTGLIIIYMLMNLPIVVWMIYSFFKDVPKEILEAGAHGRRKAAAAFLLAAAAAVAAGHRIHRAALDHPVLERGVLEHQPHRRRRPAADRLHRFLLQPRGPVLGQAVGRIAAGDRADPGVRLVQTSGSSCAA